MSKSPKKRSVAPQRQTVTTAKISPPVGKSKTKKRTAAAASLHRLAPKSGQEDSRNSKTNKSGAGSKQSRVIAMLQLPTGATIAAIMQVTGWQQHSVRGFLAGVVRKRLKLMLTSKTVDGSRVYHVASGEGGKSTAQQPKRRAA
jgi:uncharacterized protein (DUF2336 family)